MKNKLRRIQTQSDIRTPRNSIDQRALLSPLPQNPKMSNTRIRI